MEIKGKKPRKKGSGGARPKSGRKPLDPLDIKKPVRFRAVWISERKLVELGGRETIELEFQNFLKRKKIC